MSANKKPIVFAYSGQGSQYFQMGAELARQEPAFLGLLEEADAVVEANLGESVLAVMHGSARKHEPFDDIRYTGLAVLMIEHSLTRWLMARGITPTLLLGYSLGELCAHVIAGTLTFESAVRLVARQSDALARRCPRAFMAAVLGSPAKLQAFGVAPFHVACRNSAEHWVVTGAESELGRAKARAEELGLIFSMLPVRYGFHSPLVDSIEREQRLLAAATPLSSPRLEVVSCTYGSSVRVPDAEYLWGVVRLPIDLAAAASFVAARHPEVVYVDVGPSGTLATLLKPLLRRHGRSEAIPVLSPMNPDLLGVANLERRLVAGGDGAAASLRRVGARHAG